MTSLFKLPEKGKELDVKQAACELSWWVCGFPPQLDVNNISGSIPGKGVTFVSGIFSG